MRNTTRNTQNFYDLLAGDYFGRKTTIKNAQNSNDIFCRGAIVGMYNPNNSTGASASFL